VVEVLGVDEDLERPPVLMLGALVEHDVVDGHVHGVVGHRRLDLVGRADQHVRPLELLVHPHDLAGAFLAAASVLRGALLGLLRFRLLDPVLDDLLADVQRAHSLSLDSRAQLQNLP